MNNAEMAQLPRLSYFRVLCAGDWRMLLVLMLVTVFFFYITWWLFPMYYLTEASAVRNHEQERSNGRLGHGDPASPLRMEDFDSFWFYREYDL